MKLTSKDLDCYKPSSFKHCRWLYSRSAHILKSSRGSWGFLESVLCRSNVTIIIRPAGSDSEGVTIRPDQTLIASGWVGPLFFEPNLSSCCFGGCKVLCCVLHHHQHPSSALKLQYHELLGFCCPLAAFPPGLNLSKILGFKVTCPPWDGYTVVLGHLSYLLFPQQPVWSSRERPGGNDCLERTNISTQLEAALCLLEG